MADIASALACATAAKWQSLIIVIVSTIVKLCAIFQRLCIGTKKEPVSKHGLGRPISRFCSFFDASPRGIDLKRFRNRLREERGDLPWKMIWSSVLTNW
jgi:hypothetical protein